MLKDAATILIDSETCQVRQVKEVQVLGAQEEDLEEEKRRR